MKCFLILTLAVAAVVCEETYSKENDNFDVDALTNNRDQLSAYSKCFTKQGPCDALSGEFKKNIREAVEQACAKCTEPQKVILKKFLEGLQKNAPAEYEAFKAYFDPQNKYLPALQKV